MKYLFDYIDNLKPAISEQPVFLFLDYDGTISPIARKPQLAVTPKQTRSVLHELSKIPHCRIAVISGRGLEDIICRVGLKNIIYSGNHGLEIAGPQVRFKSPVTNKHRETLKNISQALHNRLKPIEGVLIQDKALSISVHYRLVDPKNVPLVKKIFCEVTAVNFIREEIRVHLGKKVIEVAPPVNWDKGKAVLWLLHNMSFSEKSSILPVYIGDDTTDEDAFKILKDSGLTIFVGKSKKSAAQYYVKNTSEVLAFLRAILDLKLARSPEIIK